MDGTGSGSCPVVGFYIRSVETSGLANRELISKLNLQESGL
jgi:hypothetical protein